MITIIVQIGNSDDKLTQVQWANFARDCNLVIKKYAQHIYFRGSSHPEEHWQNACWVFDTLYDFEILKRDIREIATLFQQDAVAWTEGETTFI